MKRKEKHVQRMWKYFVDAAAEIIEEEGIQSVTARKVGDRAGYTSSTIYNYFGELSQLVFFASMRFLNDYIDDLPSYINRGKTNLDKYMLSWECFCKHSFEKPEIYHAIFIADLGERTENLLTAYYEVNETSLENISADVRMFLLNQNLTERNHAFLSLAIGDKEGDSETAKEIVQEVNDMFILLWQGALTTLINKREETDKDTLRNSILKYMNQILYSKME